ncbi:MAG: hypothetical protein FD162_1987 [Rhodobacteraceae bacterium]|uniref:EcsC family protein n=1 Tax=Cypionkella sp. TaxID=2811411 RepID=UPI00132A7C58|nr:EcsC family protein [Cypionkella sp.]KAF0173109.1 MAG: hypothetical protein FD162_1987 [Paracoccaceae bacterium]MDO8327618.1 EcsC family protein [Cypionkella sp.]
MTQLPALRPRVNDSEIAALAGAYKRANGPVMTLVNRLGGGLEKQMALIPAPLRAQIDRAVVSALTAAHGLAGLAEEGPQMGRSASTLAAMATGAAGGAGGVLTSVAELPVTITVFLHAIRAEAIRAGYDPSEPGIRAACLEVFAAGSPLQGDDGVNSAFLSARMTLSGAAIQKVIATVAPRLAASMGQKLAAQAVPVLGALSGAALNAAFLTYYREIARIRFALMRMAETSGGEAVVAAFAKAIEPPRITKA